MTADPAYRYIGVAVQRIEDAAFLTGRGRFLDDIAPADALAAVVVRASVAPARFKL